MPTAYTGRGDPARTMALLWGVRERGARGPKPGLSLDQIVAAAIALADEEGLEGLSIRRVADRLGVGAMSLYRYVPGKAELLDVMVDRVCGETVHQLPDEAPGDWRGRLEQIARENRRLFARHPWLVQVFVGRPPLGPGIMAKYDHELRAVEDIGLTDVEMDSVLALLLGFVRAWAGSAIDAARAPARTGQTDDQWWTAFAPLIDKVFDAARFPLAARVGVAATEHYQGTYDPDYAFEFGLARLVDGVAVLVAQRRTAGLPSHGSESPP